MDLKKATDVAKDFLLNHFPDAISINLEEVELTEDKEFWYITLSYYDTNDTLKGNSLEKQYYKIFKIENETYAVYFMKIREFKSPL